MYTTIILLHLAVNYFNNICNVGQPYQEYHNQNTMSSRFWKNIIQKYANYDTITLHKLVDLNLHPSDQHLEQSPE